MRRILAYRFSALGDVAMIVPVLREILEQNPGLEIIMVSRASFADLFSTVPGLIFKGVNLDDYGGILGMRRLANELISDYQPELAIDLHDVIRSKILTKVMRRRGLPVFIIDKEKEGKERLTDIWNLDKKPLKNNAERYAETFRKAGLHAELSHQLRPLNTVKEGIGFAPFAQHFGKALPLEKSYELAKILANNSKVYFFGGGKTEVQRLSQWAAEIPNTTLLAGKFTLREELQKIASLQVMVSMDSANMHLASLAGTRCISVWGNTHPYAGFLGYGQNCEDTVQVKDLSCRPCSVFGDTPCYRGDYACLAEHSVQQILEKVLAAL